MDFEIENQKEIQMNISKLQAGKYVLRLVNEKYYTDETPFIKI